MAGNLPIQIPYKLGQQPMQPMAGMPNMTLPPLKLPDIPLEQTSIFTSNPIIDVTKVPTDTQLSSIFGQTNTKQTKIISTPKAEKAVISNKKLQSVKREIAEIIINRQPYYRVHELLNLINKDNWETAKFLLTSDEHKKRSLVQIMGIINATNKDNVDIANLLLTSDKCKTIINSKPFWWAAERILYATNKDNEELAKLLLTGKECDILRYYILSLIDILEKTNAENSELAKIICQNENITSLDKFWVVIQILNEINADNIELAKIIFKDKKLGTNDNIEEIENILKKTNADNIELAKILCQNERFTNDNNIGEIDNILSATNGNNTKLANFLCNDEKFTNDDNIEEIEDILKVTNADNIELAKILCKDEKFTKADNIGQIKYILNIANEDNVELAKTLCQDEKFTNDDNIEKIIDILAETNEDNIELAKIICKDEKFTNEDNIKQIAYILKVTNIFNIDFAKKVVQNKFIPVYMMNDVIRNAEYFKDYIDTDIFERIDNYTKNMLQNPQLYINGESTDSKSEIENFVENNYVGLARTFDIFDKESIDNLFRRRLDNAGEYLDIIYYNFYESELLLLKNMINCNNMSDKPLMPSQKVECVDLIRAFKDNDIPLSVIEEAIVDNKIDLGKIKMVLFKSILKNCGMREKEIENIPKEKLMSWNLEYMHLLPKSMEEDRETFIDLLKGANSEDFLEHIQYRETNYRTIRQFIALNMDYEKWLHPDKNLETTFEVKDKNSELLSQLAASISEDIRELRENFGIKRFFDKQFEKYIEKEEFKIPQETANSKANLTELINNIIEQLKPVWERAEKNKDNPQKQETARKTLTLLSHLQTKLESLKEMNDIKREKPFDVRIKMWDRIPQKDLFQGNFSNCCIGMGEINGEAMPHYLLNTAFNMIELVDNNLGKTIGNALCYFVQDKNDKPIFVIDNIEINNSQKPSEKTGIQLRDKMFEYAANVAKSITGKDTEIIMSGRYNDVSLEGLHGKSKFLKLIGNIDCEQIYMDLFGGWTYHWDDFEEVEYYGK